MSENATLEGVYPILATCFHADGAIDYASQERLIEFCIDGGVHGLVTLANASEGHLLSEAERRDLVAFVVERVDGRVPVIVTVNHPASRVAGEAAARAQADGASAIMAMPPFFGRWRAGPGEIRAFYRDLNDAVSIPLLVQDHVLTDIVLPVAELRDMARELARLSYVKLESGNILHKARKLIEGDPPGLCGVFGGNSGIFLPEEMAAGCCGTMPACYMPEVFRKTWDAVRQGDPDSALDFFTPYSRLAAFEKDLCNRCVWKELLVRRGVIACGAVREPAPAFADAWQIDRFLALAARLGLC